ncbi:MAG: PEP-CTERM sorting domain-containing protein [Planctomycetes bacterium]|nr:PEP-CTERM sorting domain-containing protein [Planctomycetota bacterium]
MVTVDGTGSTWTNSGYLSIGTTRIDPDRPPHTGKGTLSITGGAAVSASWASINTQSLLAIDVGRGSSLLVDSGNGEIGNDGTVRVLAGTGTTTGSVHSPISAGTWDGSGIYQAVGGTWDATEHQFTVSDVQSGVSGSVATIDLNEMQRLLIADGGTGWSLGASFLAMDVSTTLNFTATAIDTLDGLESLLGSGESVLGAWNIELDGDGYTTGDPAYLSFDIGAGYSRSGLQVWHYDGSQWTNYAASDLTYDGTYASFTVTGFSGYAVSTVPEPGTLALLLAAGLGLLWYVRRKRR